MNPNLAHELLQDLDEPFTGERLFDHLSDIVFFIKNTRAEYLVVNNTLVKRCGVKDKASLVGRTASQLFRAPLGQRFESQDLLVIKTGRPLLMQLELHMYADRGVGWCLTTKLPLMKGDGEVRGLVGVSQDLRLPDASMQEYQQVATAIDYAEANLMTPPSVPELADMAGMTRYQFDRRMQTVFGLTAGQWLLKLRIDHAQRMLTDSNESIASIAVESGYSDQSAFTRHFRQATGLTPREFRTARQ